MIMWDTWTPCLKTQSTIFMSVLSLLLLDNVLRSEINSAGAAHVVSHSASRKGKL